ncbi:hypothetical protein ARMSODRAFT_1019842 [Armillaria solidipes]|uniref:Uncharacterized protein n=1 Tax=Armillaria solidipes TaxID=1076256 RepID=A0A2H3BMR1_9AGAR|nr:hypothetical protein ARMSODRAFT_1019842 [Armillaria solidipes]
MVRSQVVLSVSQSGSNSISALSSASASESVSASLTGSASYSIINETATLSSSTITFPSGTSTLNTATITSFIFCVSITTTTKYQVSSDLSFVLKEASSLQIDQTTTTSSQSFSDPNQVTTSIPDIQSTPAISFNTLRTSCRGSPNWHDWRSGSHRIYLHQHRVLDCYVGVGLYHAELSYIKPNPGLHVGLTGDQVISWCLQVNILSEYQDFIRCPCYEPCGPGTSIQVVLTRLRLFSVSRRPNSMPTIRTLSLKGSPPKSKVPFHSSLSPNPIPPDLLTIPVLLMEACRQTQPAEILLLVLSVR